MRERFSERRIYNNFSSVFVCRNRCHFGAETVMYILCPSTYRVYMRKGTKYILHRRMITCFYEKKRELWIFGSLPDRKNVVKWNIMKRYVKILSIFVIYMDYRLLNEELFFASLFLFICHLYAYFLVEYLVDLFLVCFIYTKEPPLTRMNKSHRRCPIESLCH